MDANLNVYIADSAAEKFASSATPAVPARLSIAAGQRASLLLSTATSTPSPATERDLRLTATTSPSALQPGSRWPRRRWPSTTTATSNLRQQRLYLVPGFPYRRICAPLRECATLCATKTDSLETACPATQASFGSNGGNGMGVGADALGNVYISDGTNLLIRKVITGLQSPSTAATATATCRCRFTLPRATVRQPPTPLLTLQPSGRWETPLMRYQRRHHQVTACSLPALPQPFQARVPRRSP